MSADSWSKCPACGVSQLTGLRGAVARRGNEIPTLREDYEWWITDDGVIHGRYKCQCSRCHFVHKIVIDEHTINPG